MGSNNYHINLWTESEINLILDGDKSDEEISQITGRTVYAVAQKRYKLNNPYAQSDEFKYAEIVKEARLLSLAKTLKVKFGEKYLK